MARAILRAQGPATLAAVAAHWEELSTNNGAWLLEWAANDDPALATDLMRRALSAGPRELATAALTAASKLPLLVDADTGWGSAFGIQRTVREMTKAGADWQVINYGGTVHSFTNPDADSLGNPGLKYNKSSDERSWKAMMHFFDEIFA